MTRIVTIFSLIGMLFSWGCTYATATYPSYQRAIALHAGNGAMVGVQEQAAHCDAQGCDCPRVWHRDRWVYHCDDRFYYWYDGTWYYYPDPYFYYFDMPPPYPETPGRRITQQ